MNEGAMAPQEQIEMMRRASSEIKQLRARIEALAPKAEAWDRLGQVLGLLPQRSQGASEDVAWMLDRRATAVEAYLASIRQQETLKSGVGQGVSA